MAAIAVLMMSCGSSETPGSVAKKFYQEIADGNCEKFMKETTEPTEEELAMVSAICEKMKASLDEKGGLKSVDVVSETIAEDGKTANVVLNLTFGDGTTSEEDQKMEMQDNGKWKCVFVSVN